MTGRRDEIAAGLARVRGRIAAASDDPGAVTLIAVTKTFPATDAALLVELGVRDLGENRDQEARAKLAELSGLLPAGRLEPRWHFLGRLQRNKCRSVARYADTVHSVDRIELVAALADAAAAAGRDRLRCLVQVSLDADPARGGAPGDTAGEVAEAIASAGALRLGGVMAVAPIAADPDEAFSRLQAVSVRIRRTHPDATWISAGMSGDLEAALRHGATHVRVGSALLGRRSPVVG